MANQVISPDNVPKTGPLLVGRAYSRAQIHARFGGNPDAGIVPSKVERVILLFHTKEKAQQFYDDGYDPNEGVYWYSGQGAAGDMQWNAANTAVDTHNERGIDLYLFERAQRTGGIWRLVGVMKCIGHKKERRPGKDGKMREAIVFSLMHVDDTATVTPTEHYPVTSQVKSKEDLRVAAVKAQARPPKSKLSTKEVYERAEAIRSYALNRANGKCESCSVEAPFITKAGRPFLEVHHIARLADEGIERINHVAAICPNCHRRCHYGRDGDAQNRHLLKRIKRLEKTLG